MKTINLILVALVVSFGVSYGSDLILPYKSQVIPVMTFATVMLIGFLFSSDGLETALDSNESESGFKLVGSTDRVQYHAPYTGDLSTDAMLSRAMGH